MARRVRIVNSSRKYTPEELELVRHVPIDQLLERLGIEVLKWRKSAGYISSCPLHPPDNTPSFAIQNQGDPNKIGRWNCFHGEAGDLFDLVARIRETDRTEAKATIARWFKLYTIPAPDFKELRARLNKPKSTPNEPTIPRIPLPRTCDDIEPIINYICEHKSRKKTGYNREEAELLIKRWGLRFANNGWYANRIIIPIWDKDGKQVYYQAHAIDESLISHLPDPQNKRKLYPANAPTPFHLHNLHRIIDDYAVVVEGFWDLAALDHWHIPAVMSGQARLTPAQISLLIERCRRVFVWYDNDEKKSRNTGQHGAQMACKRLARRSVKAWNVIGPPGDPDEVGGATQALQILRKNSYRYQLRIAPEIDELKKKLQG